MPNFLQTLQGDAHVFTWQKPALVVACDCSCVTRMTIGVEAHADGKASAEALVDSETQRRCSSVGLASVRPYCCLQVHLQTFERL